MVYPGYSLLVAEEARREELALMVLTSKGAAGITGAGRSPTKVERATDRALAGATV